VISLYSAVLDIFSEGKRKEGHGWSEYGIEVYSENRND
jgi:hypothetical protein